MDKKRMLLFLIGCIGMRTLLTIGVMFTKSDYLPYEGYVGLLVACSFFYLYMNGNKYADGQLKQYGEKNIWWNEMRFVHGTFYLIFAIMAIQKNLYAWIPLGLDVIVGLNSWLKHNNYIYESR